MPVISDEGLVMIEEKFKEAHTEGTGYLGPDQLCAAFTPIFEALEVELPDTERIKARLSNLNTEKEGMVNLVEMIFLFGYMKVMLICNGTYLILYPNVCIYVYSVYTMHRDLLSVLHITMTLHFAETYDRNRFSNI